MIRLTVDKLAEMIAQRHHIEAREVLLQIIAKAYPVFEALRAEHKEGRTAKRSCSAKHPRKR